MYPGTHAAASPDRPAVIVAGSNTTPTYAELDENSARLASALRELGLRTGDVMQLETFIRELIFRAPNLRLGQPEDLVDNFVRAVKSLPYTLD